jgi:hypothetical protein
MARRPRAVADQPTLVAQTPAVPEAEVLPPDRNLGALEPIDAEIRRRRERRKDMQEAVSSWLNIAGLKLVGFVALGGFIYEGFIPGAPHTSLPAPYLLAIAGRMPGWPANRGDDPANPCRRGERRHVSSERPAANTGTNLDGLRLLARRPSGPSADCADTDHGLGLLRSVGVPLSLGP